MADTKASDFGDISAVDRTADRLPIIDASATGASKNKLVSPEVLAMSSTISAIKAGDQNSTSTTNAAATDLSVALVSGCCYEVVARVWWQSSVSTEGIGLALNLSTGTAAKFAIASQIVNSASSIRTEAESSPGNENQATNGATTMQYAMLDGIVQPNQNCNLIVEFGAETGGSNSVTVMANSYLIARRIA